MQRIRLRYRKGQELRFIGHLDIVRLWERALRRTDTPIAYTEGFNPRQKISFGPPLSLGITSDFELLDLYLIKWVSPNSLMNELNNTLPDGIRIVKSEEVLLYLPSLCASIKEAVYSFENDNHFQLEKIINSKNIFLERKGKETDVRPYIYNIFLENSQTIMITVKCDNFGTLKANEILGLFNCTQLNSLKRILLR